MKRGMFALLVLTLAASALSSPARGIAFGTADTVHAYVGAWVEQNPDGSLGWCSGELVSPRVFLTAGHCVAIFASRGATPATTWVTFDTNIFPSGVTLPSTQPGIIPGFTPPAPDWLTVSAFLADPLFNASFPGTVDGLAPFDPHDLGVVILKDPLTSVGFATLAPVGLLDTLQAGTLAQATVSVLGYGVDQNGQVTAQRRITQMPILGVAPNWLFLQATSAATGSGGIERGDSGGPELLTLGGTEYLVAVNNFGGPLFTTGTDGGYRVDTSGAEAFILQEMAANP